MVAWVLAACAGCCEVTEESHVLLEAGAGWGTRDCRAVCAPPPQCDPTSRLRTCHFDGSVGARTAVCVFEHSDCPDAPFPRSDCDRRRPAAMTRFVAACMQGVTSW